MSRPTSLELEAELRRLCVRYGESPTDPKAPQKIERKIKRELLRRKLLRIRIP